MGGTECGREESRVSPGDTLPPGKVRVPANHETAWSTLSHTATAV